MRRWDRLLDSYIEEYRARGVSAESVAMNTARLERWGLWLKARRPRVGIERIDAELITRYIESCSTFKARSACFCCSNIYMDAPTLPSVSFSVLVHRNRLLPYIRPVCATRSRGP